MSREMKEKILPRFAGVSGNEEIENVNAGDLLPRISGILKGELKLTDMVPRLEGLGIENVTGGELGEKLKEL